MSWLRLSSSPAQQFFQERRGHALGPLDDCVQGGDVQHEVPLVETDQLAPRCGVGQRQLDREVDPAGAGGERGLEQQ